jgi:hypothetical protein
MSEVTVTDLRKKVDRWHELTRAKKAIELQSENDIKPIQDELNKVIGELTLIMEAMDLDRFDGSIGKVSLVTQDYVSNPATEEAKAAFYQHLKDEGVFEEMVSVHHQKLNSYYKNKLEEAVKNQEALNIPGLEPKTRKEIRGYKL